jgi:hypothetical protein
MVRRQTWFLLILLVALIGFAVYQNQEKKTAATQAAPTSDAVFVFTSEEGIPSSIEVKPAEAEAVRVARNDQGVWVMELPFEAEANQGLAEAAASQVSSLSILGEVDANPEIFGLDHPTHEITIKFSGGNEHLLEIGAVTPTNSGYYVRVDEAKMVIAGLSGIDALLNLVNNPPYLNTPTPSPLPPTPTALTPIQAPPSEATVTPAP